MTFDSGFEEKVEIALEEKLTTKTSYQKKLKNIVRDIISGKILYYMCMTCLKILTVRQHQCPYCHGRTMKRFNAVDAIGYDCEQWIMLDEPMREKV